MEQYKNIPSTGFEVKDTITSDTTMRVSIKENGLLKLSNFSIIQLMLGSAIQGKAMSPTIMQWMIERLATVGNERELPVGRMTMIEFRGYIEARMAHCEKENDELSPNFNADTYIAMKFLLLDIREWLMCEPVRP